MDNTLVMSLSMYWKVILSHHFLKLPFRYYLSKVIPMGPHCGVHTFIHFYYSCYIKWDFLLLLFHFFVLWKYLLISHVIYDYFDTCYYFDEETSHLCFKQKIVKDLVIENVHVRKVFIILFICNSFSCYTIVFFGCNIVATI